MPYVVKDVKKYIKKEKTVCGKTAKIYKDKSGKLRAVWKVNDGKYAASNWPEPYFARLFPSCGSKSTCGPRCRKHLTKKAKRS
jgi:hypothetical protein